MGSVIGLIRVMPGEIISDEKLQKMIDDIKNPEKTKEQYIFQPHFNPEHGYRCECEECGTKYFDTWQKADEYAREWWTKNMKDIRIQ